jgi:predicted signal transduction protein with EAL and GGDEF domain
LLFDANHLMWYFAITAIMCIYFRSMIIVVTVLIVWQ